LFNREQQAAFRSFTGKDSRLTIPIFSREKVTRKEKAGKKPFMRMGQAERRLKQMLQDGHYGKL